MKLGKIKIVVRDVPETNSSASHAVSLNMDSSLRKITGLDIRDNILYIPNYFESFDNISRTNDCLTKLLYVCGIYCGNSPTAYNKKQTMKLVRVLKKFLGVKEVKFQWLEDFTKDHPEYLNTINPNIDKKYEDYELEISSPHIDSNTSDIFDEIIENEDTLLNFIFNPNSYLYGESDNISIDYINEKIDRYILRIHFGYNIGDFDIECSNFLQESLKSVAITDPHECFTSIYFDVDTDQFICDAVELFGYKSEKLRSVLSFYDFMINPRNGDIYAAFINYTNRLGIKKPTVEELLLNEEIGKLFPVTIITEKGNV